MYTIIDEKEFKMNLNKILLGLGMIGLVGLSQINSAQAGMMISGFTPVNGTQEVILVDEDGDEVEIRNSKDIAGGMVISGMRTNDFISVDDAESIIIISEDGEEIDLREAKSIASGMVISGMKTVGYIPVYQDDELIAVQEVVEVEEDLE